MMEMMESQTLLLTLLTLKVTTAPRSHVMWALGPSMSCRQGSPPA